MSIRRFKPGLVPTLVTLILLPILLRLGFWQIDRAEEKSHIQQLFEQRGQMSAFNMADGISGDIEAMKYRRTRVTGEYDSERQILLDNKVHHQAVGYHVLTPLLINGGNQAILVNRGWVHGGLDRSVLPDIAAPAGQLEINGVISIPSSKVFTLSEYNRAGNSWPAVYQWIDFADYEKASGLKILPVIILLDPQVEGGFAREWSKVNLKPEKNISYAVQWFALALALLIIYIVVNLKKVKGSSDE